MEERRKIRVMHIYRASWGALAYQILGILDLITKKAGHSYIIRGTQNSFGAILSLLFVIILPFVCILSVVMGIILYRRKADRVLIVFLFLAPIAVLITWLIF